MGSSYVHTADNEVGADMALQLTQFSRNTSPLTKLHNTRDKDPDSHNRKNAWKLVPVIVILLQFFVVFFYF